MGWCNREGAGLPGEGAGVKGMWWCNRDGAGVTGRGLVYQGRELV
jgi:hypothetical protein